MRWRSSPESSTSMQTDAARPRGWSEPGRTTLEIPTGRWRTRRPVYVEAMPPCRSACPAGEPINRWIERARAGDYATAWALIREENPFPAITGRVCAHPCEHGCNRHAYDGAVAINALERFVGDWGLEHGTPHTGAVTRAERVAIVGGGPAGLACAWHLARFGYRVQLLEAERDLGGLLRHGIPEYRLPRAVVEREIELALGPGIDVSTGVRVADDAWEELDACDAVFVATGAPTPIGLGVTGADARGVRDGLAFLRAVSRDERPDLGRHVAVVGGGSTAMDVARAARRLGAASVVVLALESRDTMPAVDDEVLQAEAEGIEIWNGVGVRRIVAHNGAVTTVVLGPAHLERGADGSIQAAFDGGIETTIAVGSVVTAIGQRPDLAALPPRLVLQGAPLVGTPDGATSLPRYFIGGDLTGPARTVAAAIGAGARAARAIHAALSRSAPRGFFDVPAFATAEPDDVVDRSRVGFHAFPRVPRVSLVSRPVETRIRSFEEVQRGLDEHAARAESGRCFTCGHCVACDTCAVVCPDMAVRRVDRGYELATDYCKGCGLCVRECPRGALVMERERGRTGEEARTR